MILDELYFNVVAKNVRVVQTLRGEIDCNDNYSQWNLCDYTGDDALRVLDARMAFCQEIGIDLDNLVMPCQSHSTNVEIIDDVFLNAPIAEQDSRLENVDALVTNLPGVCIGVNTADCVPIALADLEHNVIAIAHAGWRGTVNRIAEAVVKVMCNLGSIPENILATMGASICYNCFEVGDEVVRAFEQAGFEMPLIVHRNVTTGRAHINLQEANRQVLVDAGLCAENITLPQHCSRCESDSYFSARRIGINSGRTFTGVILKNELSDVL